MDQLACSPAGRGFESLLGSQTYRIQTATEWLTARLPRPGILVQYFPKTADFVVGECNNALSAALAAPDVVGSGASDWETALLLSVFGTRAPEVSRTAPMTWRADT